MTDRRRLCQSLVLPALLLPLALPAGVIDSVNGLRQRGCGAPPGAPPLHASARLEEVARQLSQGVELSRAEQLAGYHALSSFSVHVSGVPPSGDVARALSGRFCRQVGNPAFRELGSWRQGGEVWLALAEPFAPPAERERAAVGRRVLELANEARARPRRCGATEFPAAPPLTANATLERAAAHYARDLASHSYMEHTGRDGSSPQERLTRSGYRWREAGENLASGIMSPEDVVTGWLHSPEHCANLMDSAFSEMGVAFAVNPRDAAGVYWALELGRPR